MKKVLFGLFICFSVFLFSQDARDSYLANDLKIGLYNNDNKQKDTLGIFIAKPNLKGGYSLCLDIFSKKRKESYSGLGIAIDDNKLDRFYHSLRVAQKEFEKRVSQTVVMGNMRIGGQVPVHIYQWSSQDRNGPENRMSQKKNQKLYPLSIEVISSEKQQELWIYTSGETSNPKEIAIVFNSLESITQFLNAIEPGSVRQKHSNHFNLRGKK